MLIVVRPSFEVVEEGRILKKNGGFELENSVQDLITTELILN
jgi:hypothetical protein